MRVLAPPDHKRIVLIECEGPPNLRARNDIQANAHDEEIRSAEIPGDRTDNNK